VPLQLPANTALIRGVACSDKFVMCWDSLGKLYTWGDGQYGRLGLGCRKGNYNYVEYKPTKLEALADLFIVGACCGEDHALAITDQH
jgi:alpha-tubulin suppressor-like RCC1 family protein